MSLGVHFALSERDLETLAAFDAPEERQEFLEEHVEERYLGSGDHWAYQSDKAWDAIDRCLAPRSAPRAQAGALSLAVLGGSELELDDEYVARLVEIPQVIEVERALKEVTRATLRARYDQLAGTDYAGTVGDADFDYTWKHFEGMRRFFARAATARRAVLFTAS